ncbi:23S rRNA (guanosine(2251)-2'-O)-methyltransferase RlmB [Lottiidibacillus patelloidae]
MEEWIAGKNPVLEALRAGREINKIWIAESAQKNAMKPVIALAKESGIIVQFVPRKKIDGVAKTDVHQGVVASIAAYKYAEIEDIFRLAEKREEQPFMIILDELEDPHNLGSILRTADATGAHGVIIPKRRAVGLTATVAKASTGAIEYIPVARVTNLSRTIEDLKAKGVWVAGTDASAKQDYREMEADMPLALVIGSEGKGMSRIIKEKCDFLLTLPMLGKVTSLNASVAASLLMYEVLRKRMPIKR